MGAGSTSREIVAADGRRYAFADHNCFACGAENPIGMGLHIELGEGTARAAPPSAKARAASAWLNANARFNPWFMKSCARSSPSNRAPAFCSCGKAGSATKCSPAAARASD